MADSKFGDWYLGHGHRKAQPLPEDRGPQKPYVMLSAGTHGGVKYRPGEIVMLYDDEVADHHREIKSPEPEEPEPPEMVHKEPEPVAAHPKRRPKAPAPDA